MPAQLTHLTREGRRGETNGDILDSTLKSVPDTPTDAEATTNAEKIAPQLQAITNLLTGADSDVVKRALVESYPGKPHYGKPDLFKTISYILYELLFTVKVILFKLGLGTLIAVMTWIFIRTNTC